MIKLMIFLMMILVLFACSNAEHQMDEARDDADSEEVEQSEESLNGGDAGFSGHSDREEVMEEPDSDTAALETGTQMVIYNGTIAVEVEDYDQTHRQIQEEVSRLGGFITESSVYQHGEDENRTGTLTARIPQAEFFPFLDRVEAGSSRVTEKSAHGNDVTEEYIDLESRLRSKETVEERLLSFMDEADDTENLLKISNDLARVQEEIETLKGRMNYLEDHVAFSTVTVYIHERSIRVAPLQDREHLNTFERAQSLFMSTINVILSALSGLVVFLIGLSPVIIPLAGAAFVLYIVTVKRTKRVG
ncbi:hypothetical protein CR205_11105 [Alteribacter lacisalsi]|uniref:DUF4349 domain-containing protein n=1 Tax=Alteribacter lacisalsi TaxID=2045244 RepID=A0A2W0HNB9_9BACI|nr:DUF4349 domain-containing protein [Alteribacter lacisalsi]PYZ99075.1 hypothetical protein CR205_11105 [Alteribacter lacisalsi]